MDKRNEVLTFMVDITTIDEVKGAGGEAVMLAFTGRADCENFKGTILPGGIDTQKQWGQDARTLSARYILEGTDCEGERCRIFVENNGIVPKDGGEMVTTPQILTDSKVLSYLETAKLSGTLTPREKGVTIHIYECSLMEKQKGDE